MTIKPSTDIRTVFHVTDLRKLYPVRTGFLESLTGKKEYVHAVDGISFNIHKGEVLCLVGESGSGKTTTARLILRLDDPTSGEIQYTSPSGETIDLAKLRQRHIRKFRKDIQIVFQNPYESLDPRMTVFEILSEPLRINNLCKRSETPAKIFNALNEVGLIPPEDFCLRFPHELSGGQRQRVSIARALVFNPEFMVADEPASMLDANTRIEILNLLLDLQATRNMSILFITHDLAQARYIGHTIVILYLGKIVEVGDVEAVIKTPRHPYTRVLISNIPVPDPDAKRERIDIEGEIPTAINLPPGCRFAPRCPFVFDKCHQEEPELEMKKGRLTACWLD